MKDFVEYEFVQFFKNGTKLDQKSIIGNYEFLEYIFNDFMKNKKELNFEEFLNELYSNGVATIHGIDTFIRVKYLF